MIRYPVETIQLHKNKHYRSKTSLKTHRIERDCVESNFGMPVYFKASLNEANVFGLTSSNLVGFSLNCFTPDKVDTEMRKMVFSVPFL